MSKGRKRRSRLKYVMKWDKGAILFWESMIEFLKRGEYDIVLKAFDVRRRKAIERYDRLVEKLRSDGVDVKLWGV